MDGLFLTSRRHWWERVNNTVIEFHLSETSGSYRLIDRDANDCAISPPRLGKGQASKYDRFVHKEAFMTFSTSFEE